MITFGYKIYLITFDYQNKRKEGKYIESLRALDKKQFQRFNYKSVQTIDVDQCR